MKKIIILSLAAMAAFALASCKSTTSTANSNSQRETTFGEVEEAPCTVYDTKEEFKARGIFKGSKNQLGEVEKNALFNAQDLVRNKMSHAYQGMVSDYSSSIGNNKGNDIERKMTSAGDKIIDIVVNDTYQTCTRFDKYPDDKGMVTCYTAISVSKVELAAKIAKEVADNLTQEEKDRIGFNEQEYRKQMEERFKNYRESH